MERYEKVQSHMVVASHAQEGAPHSEAHAASEDRRGVACIVSTTPHSLSQRIIVEWSAGLLATSWLYSRVENIVFT